MTSEEPAVSFTAIDDVRPMAELKPGGVMPVTVLKATGANVVVFSIDAGAELREHHSHYPILLQALQGSVIVGVDGQQITLRPGGLVHIEADVPHSVRAAVEARLQLTVLMIDSPGPSKVPLVE